MVSPSTATVVPRRVSAVASVAPSLAVGVHVAGPLRVKTDTEP